MIAKQKNVEGTSLTLNTIEALLNINLKGSTTQSGTPTPTSPIDVKVVSGDNTIKIIGKNIFNQDVLIPNMINNATYKQYSDGVLTITNNTTDTFMPSLWGNANYIAGININVDPNTDYVFSFEVDQALTTLKNAVMGLNTSTNKYQYIIQQGQTQYFTQTNILKFNSGDYTTIAFRIGSTASVNTITHFSKFQLEKGNTKTDYEEYKELDYSINLETIELCKIGDYQDYIYKNNNKWYKHSEVGKIVLDGTNKTLSYYGTYGDDNAPLFYRNIDDMITPSAYTEKILFSDNYSQYLGSTPQPMANNQIRGATSRGRLYLRDDRYSSANSMNTWLSSNNVTVYYVLAEGTDIEITDTTLLEQLENLLTANSYKGITNILQLNNSDTFDLDVYYYEYLTNFIEECKKSAYCNRYGRHIFTGLTITENNQLVDFSIESGCYDNGNIIGNAYVKKIESNLLDSLDDNIVDEDFTASVGVTYEENNEDITEYIDLGNYVVEKPTDTQTGNATSIIGYDDLLTNLDKPYETLLDYDNNTITLSDVYVELCSILGLIPESNTFTNSTLTVEGNPFTNGEKNRDVLRSIEKVSCSFVDIDTSTNKIKLKWLSNNLDYTFTKDDYSTLEGGKVTYGPINSLVIKNSVIDSENVSINDPESITTYGEHQFVITEDYFLYNAEKRQAVINNIWDKVHNLQYVDCKLTSLTGKPFLTVGDKIRIYTGENDYIDTYVLKHKFTYDGSFKSEIESPVLTQQEVQTKQDITLGEKLTKTQIIVDKQNQTISSVVEDVSGQNTKISTLTQRVDNIESSISDIADLTVSGESSSGVVELDNVNESEPIMIKIHPTSNNISYLYPRDNLYPSDTLYSPNRIIKFHNETTNEDVDYEIPNDLLYYDSEHYDEFYLDYDSNTCQITKKCKYNADGTVSLLSSEVVNTYTYPYIPLDDGNYTVSVYGYSNAYIFARLMSKNIYTSQFYTKAETNSAINQKANEIDLSVNSKLSNYSTTAQMNSAISLSANQITSSVSETYATKTTTNSLSSRINQTAKSVDITVTDNGTSAGLNIKLKNEDGTQIDSESANITMSGLVKFTDLSGSGTTTINGSNITTGTISTNRLNADVITTSNFSLQSLNADNITSGTLSTSRLAADVITTSNISTQELNASKITAGTLSVDRLSAGSITGTKIANNTITSNNIDSLSASKITTGTLNGNNVSVTNLSASNIKSGSLTSTSVKIGSWSCNGTGISSSNGQIYPDYLGFKSGGTGAWTSQAWWRIGAAASDKRLKKDIEKLTNNYDKFFDELKPVSFKWKESINEKSHIGFIAQDIQEAEKNNNLDLDMVYNNETDDILNLDKRDIIALNTWQIQLLKQQVKSQQEQIDLLKQEIQELKEGR